MLAQKRHPAPSGAGAAGGGGGIDRMRTGIELIAEERAAQKTREGYNDAHDDAHRAGEIAMAAACYALPGFIRECAPFGQAKTYFSRLWPWEADSWKPSPESRVRELVKAGALIAAEIDRLQRARAVTDSPLPNPARS